MQEVFNIIEECFKEEGNTGLKNELILKKYLNKLPFEVKIEDIKIEGWYPQTEFDFRTKKAEVFFKNKSIGFLYYQNIM